MRIHSHRGFTLIELLVVIAIIAILAGIIFPVFAQARVKAQQARCASNLKQMAQAMLMYAQDHDECFNTPYVPWVWACQTSGASLSFFHHLWYPYVKNRDVFFCPQLRYDWNCPYVLSPPHTDESRKAATSYGLTCLVADMSPGTSYPYIGMTLSQMKRPAQMAALSEGLYPETHRFLGPLPNNPLPPSLWCASTMYLEVHNGGVNVAYFDGHVKWMSSKKYWAPSYNDFLTYLPWSNADQELPGW
jgi:prepilin-type N-terminal cleavage/methylation domain-containing protein/prepilin-type processing-associated H-X9-DG protein